MSGVSASSSPSKWQAPKQIWKHPNPSFTRVEAFRRFVNHRHGKQLNDYYDLHEYSITDWTFWKDVWDFGGTIYSAPPTEIVSDTPLDKVPKWFTGARLNYAENLLKRNDDATIVTSIREHGHTRHFSSRELREMVRKMRNAMIACSLTVGDRVAAIATNSVETLVIMLAATSIGAIYSSTATDMGVNGILDRYRQIRPKLVFSETGIIYAGKRLDMMPKVRQVVAELSNFGLQQTILLSSTVAGLDAPIDNLSAVTLSNFLMMGDPNRPLQFEQLPFMHPLYVLYSSGTTGPPKCIVHTAGGVLLQGQRDYMFHLDVHWGDTYFQYTTCAWMMWNAFVVCLSLGARILMYDGSPFHPTVGSFLKMIDKEGATHWGTSPRFLSELQGQNIHFRDYGNFESLRVAFVTGAVLTPPSYLWCAKELPKHTHVLAGSGGTDICASFVASNTALPGYAGEMQVKGLGMKVEIFDPEGNNIENTGEPGELVCTRAHPSQPLSFWGDESGEKLRDAYFSRYPGVWTQGDFMVINPLTKGIYILGRSDGVLNPSGVRFGSGEIYTVMEQFGDVVDDSIVVGQRRPQDIDERVILFLKMREHRQCTEDLKQRMRSAIRNALSARHVPSYIFEVPEIPYTVNNKKIEIAVKQIVSGSKIKPSGTVANPESLQHYYRYQNIEEIANSNLKAKL